MLEYDYRFHPDDDEDDFVAAHGFESDPDEDALAADMLERDLLGATGDGAVEDRDLLGAMDDGAVEARGLPADDIEPESIELEKIPQRLWELTLAPIRRQPRFYVAQRVPDEQLRQRAVRLALDLDLDDERRRRACDEARQRARSTGAPLPTPDAGHASSKPTVQVNLRLRRDDYEQLVAAATGVGLRPTTLARALVLNGVNAILRQRG